MSSKSTPLDGKSGNCRRPLFTLLLRLEQECQRCLAFRVGGGGDGSYWASLVALAEEAVDCPPWAASLRGPPVLPSGPWRIGCGAVSVGSGLVSGACEAVEGLSEFCVLGPVLEGWPWGGCWSKETGVPDIAKGGERENKGIYTKDGD